jgi:hypothetical protein
MVNKAARGSQNGNAERGHQGPDRLPPSSKALSDNSGFGDQGSETRDLRGSRTDPEQ